MRGPSEKNTPVLIPLVTFACGEDGTDGAEVANECVEAELVAQCPAGTLPRLEANAETSFNESGSLNVNASGMEGGGEISQVCVGSGSCQVVCELSTPCAFGVERLSRDEVFCAAAPVGASCNEESAPRLS